MSTIVEIADTMATIIEALTPVYESHITYREILGDLPIEKAPLGASPSDNSRQFEVRPSTQLSLGLFHGGYGELGQQVTVFVRYDGTYTDEGWKRIARMAGYDAACIRAGLESPPAAANWSDTTAHPEYRSSSDLVESRYVAGSWLTSFTYDIKYDLEC